MESNIPKYDLPVDYIVGEGFAKDLLKSYKNSQLYTLMYQSKNELILYYQLQGNNKTDLFCG